MKRVLGHWAAFLVIALHRKDVEGRQTKGPGKRSRRRTQDVLGLHGSFLTSSENASGKGHRGFAFTEG